MMSKRIQVALLLQTGHAMLRSFNSTITPMCTVKFCSVIFGLYLLTDKNVVQAWCHKQDSLMLTLRRPCP